MLKYHNDMWRRQHLEAPLGKKRITIEKFKQNDSCPRSQMTSTARKDSCWYTGTGSCSFPHHYARGDGLLPARLWRSPVNRGVLTPILPQQSNWWLVESDQVNKRTNAIGFYGPCITDGAERGLISVAERGGSADKRGWWSKQAGVSSGTCPLEVHLEAPHRPLG